MILPPVGEDSRVGGLVGLSFDVTEILVCIHIPILTIGEDNPATSGGRIEVSKAVHVEAGIRSVIALWVRVILWSNRLDVFTGGRGGEFLKLHPFGERAGQQRVGDGRQLIRRGLHEHHGRQVRLGDSAALCRSSLEGAEGFRRQLNQLREACGMCLRQRVNGTQVGTGETRWEPGLCRGAGLNGVDKFYAQKMCIRWHMQRLGFGQRGSSREREGKGALRWRGSSGGGHAGNDRQRDCREVSTV